VHAVHADELEHLGRGRAVHRLQALLQPALERCRALLLRVFVGHELEGTDDGELAH